MGICYYSVFCYFVYVSYTSQQQKIPWGKKVKNEARLFLEWFILILLRCKGIDGTVIKESSIEIWMYFSPVEFLVLICFISCLLTTFLCWFFFTVIIFIKLCKASWQVWVKRHPTLFFFLNLSKLAWSCSPASLSPWQQICPPGSGNLWAVLSLCWGMPGQSRLSGSWGLLPAVTGNTALCMAQTGQEGRRFSVCLSGKMANHSPWMSPVSDRWKSWKEKLQDEKFDW